MGADMELAPTGLKRSPVDTDTDDARTLSAREGSVIEPPDQAQASTSKEAAQPGPDDAQVTSPAPDGGAEAWLLVLGVWCTSFCSFGWINSIGIFQEYYQNGPLSSYSPSTIAWIPSLQVFFMMATGPIVGNLHDSHGPRHLLLTGTFLHVLGLMLASVSTRYYQFLLTQGVVSAAGVAAIFQPAIACIPDYFSRRRGAAYGLLSTGSSLGGVLFPVMVSRLLPRAGYGWTMRTCAFVILGLLVVANVTVKKRVRSKPSRLSREQALAPLREGVFLGLLAGMFLLTFGIWVPIDFLTVEAVGHGMTAELGQYLVSMFNAGSLGGRMLSGILADRLGKFNVFVICCYTAAVLVLAMWIPTPANQDKTIAFAVLFGFFSGAYIALTGGLVAEISPPREIGFRTGLVFLVASLPGLVTSPIAGQILGSSGGWTGLKLFSGIFCAAGTTCILASRIIEVGWKLNAVF